MPACSLPADRRKEPGGAELAPCRWRLSVPRLVVSIGICIEERGLMVRRPDAMRPTKGPAVEPLSSLTFRNPVQQHLEPLDRRQITTGALEPTDTAGGLITGP